MAKRIRHWNYTYNLPPYLVTILSRERREARDKISKFEELYREDVNDRYYRYHGYA